MKNKSFRNVWGLTLILVLIVSCGLPGATTRKPEFYPEPPVNQRLEPILRLDSGGHAGVITDLLATSDQKYIISSSNDKTIRVWDVQTGLELRRILGWLERGGEGKIYAMALSPDDKLLAVGGFFTETGDQHIRVYDFVSGKMLESFAAHDSPVLDMAFSPDGLYLISGSADSSVKVWSAENNFELFHAFNDSRKAVSAVGVFKHGNEHRAVSSGNGDKIFLYSLDSKKTLASRSHTNSVLSLAVGASYIVVGSRREINIFDLDLNPVKTLSPEISPAALAFSPDGKLLLSGSLSHPYVCDVYSVEDGFKKVQSFYRHDNFVGAVAFLDNQTAVTGGGDDKSIYLWSPVSGEVKERLTGKGRSIWTVGISGQDIAWGNVLAPRSINYMGDWKKRFNLKTFVLERPSDFSGFQRISTEYQGYSITHSKGGEQGVKNAVLEIRPPDSKTISIIRGAADGISHNAYGFTPKGVIVSGGDNGVMTAYNIQGQKLADFEGHAGAIWSIGSDGAWLISGGSDQVVKLWNLKPLEKGRTKIYPALNIFAGEDDEWVAWTEEGFFAASPEGGKYVGYHINQGRAKEAKYISVDQLYHAFHRPDLVKAKLRGLDISGFARHIHIRKILDSGGLPPEIRIVTPAGFSRKRDIYLKAEICDRGGGVGDFNFQLNDRPRRLVRSEFVFTRSKTRDHSCPEKYLVKKKIPLSLIDERAVISLSAYNRTNTIRGNTDEMRIDFPNPARRRADLHILAIAVDRYADKNMRLRHARADAQALVNVLKEKAAPLFQNIKVYPVYDALAAKKGIEKNFRRVAAEAKAEDLFVLFMAGHGKVYGKTGEYYFLPVNFEYSHESALPEQGISTEDLSRWTGMIEARKTLFMLDTCHGKKAMTELEMKFMTIDREIAEQEAIQKLAKAVGRSFMAAGGDRLALEGERYQGHGAFSWTLLRGLSGGEIKIPGKNGEIVVKADKNNNGYITLGELAEFVRQSLPQVTLEKSLYKQVPYVSSPDDDDYPLSVPGAPFFPQKELKGD